MFIKAKTKEKEIEKFLGTKDFLSALRSLASLIPDFNRFFDHGLVMVKDEKVKNNSS